MILVVHHTYTCQADDTVYTSLFYVFLDYGVEKRRMEDYCKQKQWHNKFEYCITNTVLAIQIDLGNSGKIFWLSFLFNRKVVNCKNLICTGFVMQY